MMVQDLDMTSGCDAVGFKMMAILRRSAQSDNVEKSKLL